MFEYSTPAKPISTEHFTSLRERVARESPKLYRNKVLSEPGKKEAQKTFMSTKKVPKPVNVSQEQHREIGSFENPVLHTLAHRTVNKEQETKRLVVNVVSLAVWDLVGKFTSMLLSHSNWGKQLMASFGREMAKHGIQKTVACWYLRYPRVLEKINWQNLNLIFHAIVLVNIVVSLWRLFAKVKTDDLQLSENQKKLLGVDGDQKKSSQEGEADVEELKSVKESLRSPPEPPNTPFLFKSLETPMKTRQREHTEEPQRKTQSVAAKKVNAFGTLDNGLSRGVANGRQSRLSRDLGVPAGSSNPGIFTPRMAASAGAPAAAAAGNFSTPVGRTGYIPSSKYTYMMNTPSPAKRM